MRHLCAVVFLAAGPVWAAPAQVETRLSTVSTSGTAFVNPQTATPSVSSFSSLVSVRSKPLMKDSLVLNASATQSKNDYSSVTITSATGEKRPLSETFDKSETSVDAGVEWKRDDNTASVSYGQTVTDSPYAFKGATAAYNRTFYGNTSAVGGEYSAGVQKLPLTFFDDPSDNFHSKQRRDSLRTRRTTVWFEQILSESWKSHARVFEGGRSDRPQHVGLEWRNSYAINDRLFARLDVGMLTERREQALRDERGYFDVYWTELQASIEPIYDFLVTASAGTTVERETIPVERASTSRPRKNQFGLDVYGLRLNYKGRRWSSGLQGQLGTSNTSYRTSYFGGNVIWEI